MLKCSTVGDVVVRNRSLLTIRLMYVLLGPSMDGSMDEYCVSMFEAALTQLAAPEEVKEVKEEVKEEEKEVKEEEEEATPAAPSSGSSLGLVVPEGN